MQEIEFHRALHRPGTIVDVGAHDGRLTLPLAQLPASRVVAFEPLSASVRPPEASHVGSVGQQAPPARHAAP